MKCKTCNFRGRKTSPKCWELFSQCGNCASRDHPEVYNNIICKSRIEKRTIVLCSICGNRSSKLKAFVNSYMNDVDGRYCFECKLLRVNDQEIRIERYNE